MRDRLRPTDEAVTRLARAECDPEQAHRFAPIALGFLGNLLLILLVGTLGVLCALLLLPLRRSARPGASVADR